MGLRISKDTDKQKYLINMKAIHTITDVLLGACSELSDKRMQVIVN